jgi:hypothetical protein
MAKLTLQDITNLQNESTVVTVLKGNNDSTEIALENTLSRDGLSPNQMLSNLDMNNYKIINLPDATTDQEPATYSQLNAATTAVGNGAVLDAPYVTVSNDPTLLSERVLTGSANISITDGGAQNPVTVAISDAELNALAGVTSAADTVPYFTGSGTASTTPLTSYARTLIDDADATTARATLGAVIGTNVQAWDTDLDALAGVSTSGILTRTGAGTATTRTITQPAAGITVTNGSGVSGNPTLALSNDLAAYEGLSTNGLVARTATDTATTRTITGTANEITLANGDGVSGNPTVSIPSAVTFTGKTVTGGTYASPSLTTPNIGVATATSVNKVAITAPATSATLTIPDGVTLTGPAASGTAMTLGNTETVTGVKTFGSAGAVGRFKLAGTTSGSTVLDATAVASGTITVPAATDILVARNTTDTLTNKTLTSPTLTTPSLGVATATSINKVALTQPASGSTLTVADGKTLTANNTLTFSGTDSSTLNVGVGGTLTGSSSSAIFYDTIPQNSQSAAYTLVLSDAEKHIYHPSADTTARVWTIPANSSVAYPIGTAITFVNDTSAGAITISITTDTLVLAGAGTTGSRTLAASGIATALKVTSTRWIISGTNLT